MREEEFSALLKADAKSRYKYFISQVADNGALWSLYESGWVMAKMRGATVAFPVWPRQEFATACKTGEWEFAEARKISLQQFTRSIVPNLIAEDTLVAVFSTPSDRAVSVLADRLVKDLEIECSRFL